MNYEWHTTREWGPAGECPTVVQYEVVNNEAKVLGCYFRCDGDIHEFGTEVALNVYAGFGYDSIEDRLIAEYTNVLNAPEGPLEAYKRAEGM